jgi:Transport protein Avl9
MPVLHILVVGFHHKKGCQVSIEWAKVVGLKFLILMMMMSVLSILTLCLQIEFAYPPLVATPNTSPSGEPVCPSGWKYLPTLALPDGSHNFYKDCCYFNVPSLTDPQQSIYGVSCFRQVAVEKLKNVDVDVTRSTVQKSVCALLAIPIYGYIEVKLSLIADAFFEQGDFSATNILHEAYEELNAVLQNCSNPLLQHLNVGLTIRDLVLRWRSKILTIFKLLLLQKRVICFGSPVRPVCNMIMSIISLHPQVIASGFQEVACVNPSRPMSPMPDFKGESVPEERGTATTASASPTTSETSLPEDSISKKAVESGGSEGGAGDGKVLQREISIDTMACKF